MTAALTNPTWESRAACRGAQSDCFVSSVTGESATQRQARESSAKRICAGCPVQRECLDYTLRVREPFGIWGGKNEAERRVLLAST